MLPFKVDIWCQDHHVILPKTEPPLLNKLRNIQILDADYNSYYKCKVNHQLFRKKFYIFYKNRCMEEFNYDGHIWKS